MTSYRFHQLAGRLINTPSSISQGLRGGGEAGSKIIFESQHVKIARAETEYIKPTKKGYGPMSKQMLANYKKFQVDDGVPVHLKGGQMDKVLYYTTLVLCAIGLEESFRYLYRASFPKRE